jgi:beta-galactosidase
MIREYTEWMRDNWNHPAVVIWDANNETDSTFGEKIMPAVRGLDSSNRPWENSYNPPEGPDDPVEDHRYEYQVMADGGSPFSMTTLESPGGMFPGAPTGHALILNEYGWLWWNRDGTPTELTKRLYPALLPPAKSLLHYHVVEMRCRAGTELIVRRSAATAQRQNPHITARDANQARSRHLDSAALSR